MCEKKVLLPPSEAYQVALNGTCLRDVFFDYCSLSNEESVRLRRLGYLTIIGDRVHYMRYSLKDFAWREGYPSVVEALLGGDGALGLKAIRHLVKIMPRTSLSTGFDKEIVIHDVLSPYQIADDIVYYGNSLSASCPERWAFCGRGGFVFSKSPITTKDNRAIFSDERFLIVVADKEDIVEMWILATPPSEAENNAT